MAIRWEAKRPGEVRDYVIDWSLYLDGDTIVAGNTDGTGDAGESTVSVVGLILDSVAYTDTTVTVWVSGGADGDIAKVTNTIITAGGRTETEIFTLQVRAGSEPLSLAVAKEHLGVLSSDWDGLICSYLRGAREFCEKYSGHILVRRQITEHRGAFADPILLYKRPLISVDEVAYTDTAGAEQTYTGFVLQDGYPAKLRPAFNGAWPEPWGYGGVSITYTAGYAEGEVPETFIQAIKLLIGHWFANREAVTADTRSVPHEVQFAVKALLDRDSFPSVA